MLLSSTRRCRLFQLGVFRQERLDNLIGLNFQLSFPELPCQRVWRLVVAHLKNSGIDGEDYDLTVAIRPDFDRQFVAGFRSLGHVERELDLTLRRDTAEWRRSILFPLDSNQTVAIIGRLQTHLQILARNNGLFTQL